MPQKTYTCKECGKRAKVGAYDDDMRLFERRLCFTCAFWAKYVELEHDVEEQLQRLPMRSGGVHRVGVMDNSAKGFKGFGGTSFIFEHIDGRVIFCNNVWQQGAIPERFKDRLPDNGRFLTTEEARTKGLIGPTQYISSFAS